MKYMLLRRVIVIDSEMDGIAKGETTLMVEDVYSLEKVVDAVLPMVEDDEIYSNYTEEELRNEIYKELATTGSWHSMALYSRKLIAGLILKVRFVIKSK